MKKRIILATALLSLTVLSGCKHVVVRHAVHVPVATGEHHHTHHDVTIVHRHSYEQRGHSHQHDYDQPHVRNVTRVIHHDRYDKPVPQQRKKPVIVKTKVIKEQHHHQPDGHPTKKRVSIEKRVVRMPLPANHPSQHTGHAQKSLKKVVRVDRHIKVKKPPQKHRHAPERKPSHSKQPPKHEQRREEAKKAHDEEKKQTNHRHQKKEKQHI